jgi:hypothetical protein
MAVGKWIALGMENRDGESGWVKYKHYRGAYMQADIL